MKYLICSDIHGDAQSAEAILKAYEEERADKILILGDILYHGPRNDLPQGYAPKAVINLLNANKEKIMAIRGNCDTEVDQMVLEFPILAEYALIDTSGLLILATHGHKINAQTSFPFSEGQVLLHGHTHIPVIEDFGNKNTYINPGSCAIPKGGYEKSYATLEGRSFIVKSLDGRVIMQKDF
jgi:putative phosphoesterase